VARVVHELVTRARNGHESRHDYETPEPLRAGAVVQLRDQWWIVDAVAEGASGRPAVIAVPARYRLVLRHADGQEELGAFRRIRPGAPGIGHAFTTLVGGEAVSWQVVEERLARDEAGQPYRELIAERDHGEADGLPAHELEHLEQARELLAPAEERGRAVEPGIRAELVALEPGRMADWDEAARYIDALTLEEIDDNLLELCGVLPDSTPRTEWLTIVRDRLLSDLEAFREDLENEHDEIESWDSDGSLIFASVGTWEDEADPTSGHGWMVRLVDSGALGAAGFQRVRKAEL
jgi:hypothetical protein